MCIPTDVVLVRRWTCKAQSDNALDMTARFGIFFGAAVIFPAQRMQSCKAGIHRPGRFIPTGQGAAGVHRPSQSFIVAGNVSIVGVCMFRSRVSARSAAAYQPACFVDWAKSIPVLPHSSICWSLGRQACRVWTGCGGSFIRLNIACPSALFSNTPVCLFIGLGI